MHIQTLKKQKVIVWIEVIQSFRLWHANSLTSIKICKDGIIIPRGQTVLLLLLPGVFREQGRALASRGFCSAQRPIQGVFRHMKC